MKNVQIKEIAVYRPEKRENVETYIKHFKKQGKDTEELLKRVYGRKSYYMIDNEGKAEEDRENSLTMKIKAATEVLRKSNLSAKDIDALIVPTQAPEHMIPPDSLWLHKALGLRQDIFAYDVNSNCASMLTALEQAYYYMEMKPSINRMLLVGGDYLTYIPRPDQELIYGCFGDSACAIILERTEDDSHLIATDYFINTEFADKCFFPDCGLSNILTSDQIQARCLPVGADIPIVIEKIKKMLDEHGLTVDDISSFCFSQYVIANINLLKEGLNIPDEKCPYVGDEYGYTASTSPFLALNKAVEEGRIKHGDYLFFWTIGNGMQHIFMLIKY